MFRRVLVATDFSRYADRILECIGEIPGMEEILLVHVFIRPDFRLQQILEEKRYYLQQTTGIPVKSLLVEGIDGDIAKGIVTSANNNNSSLIILGAQGKGFIGKLLLGSVSNEVIQRAGIDVLMMRFPGLSGEENAPFEKFCRNVFSNVLCPIDFSKPSEKTVEYLKSLKVIRKVILLHVLSKGDLDLIEVAEQKILEIQRDLESQGIQATSFIRDGDPISEICREAEEQNVSLIMLARFGRSDYARNISLGHVVSGVAAKAQRPLIVLSPHISLKIGVRELREDEFHLAKQVWLTYHQQRGDPLIDRIFGVFVEGTLIAVARCRRHPDGLEMDAVYVIKDYRDRGYARKAVQALIDTCGDESIYIHSTLVLVPFYQSFGFEIIPESALPPSIRKRFEFAVGNLAGLNISPMRRVGKGIK